MDAVTTGLTSAEAELQARARRFADEVVQPVAARIDSDGEYPWDVVQEMTSAGFMGMTIPRAYGGQGRSLLEACLVIEQLARQSTVTARIAVEANVGAVSAIMEYGSEEQRKLAAKLIVAGDKPAICITEPDAGSDATAMSTRADKRGDRYVINGCKHWITGAGVSNMHLIFARTFDEYGEYLGIGGFLALANETDTIRRTKREQTMGLRGMPEGEIIFSDLVVDGSSLLVPPDGLARGFGSLMNAYNCQRVGAGTVAMGIATGAFERALAWSKTREQFGRPIGEFQGLQWKIADMDVALTGSRLMLHAAARSRGPGRQSLPRPDARSQGEDLRGGIGHHGRQHSPAVH